MSKKIKLSIETASYNDRRYSPPWIARVDFTNKSQGEFAWGEWIGDRGCAGLLELDVEPGDIVARGQKDLRKPQNSSPDWFCVGLDGSLYEIAGRAEALQMFRRGKAIAAREAQLIGMQKLQTAIEYNIDRLKRGTWQAQDLPEGHPGRDSEEVVARVKEQLSKDEKSLAVMLAILDTIKTGDMPAIGVSAMCALCIGWRLPDGSFTDTIPGYEVEAFFRDKRYLGPDDNGIEPVFRDLGSEEARKYVDQEFES